MNEEDLNLILKQTDDACLIVSKQLVNLLQFNIISESYKLGLMEKEQYEFFLKDQMVFYETMKDIIAKWESSHTEEEQKSD